MPLSYPINLPIPLVSGYKHSDAQKVMMTSVETGVPRFELINTITPSFPTVTWLFKSLEFQVFEGFYRHTLKLGSISFRMQLKVGDGVRVHDCFFEKPYRPTLQGKLWRVTANLVTLEKKYG